MLKIMNRNMSEQSSSALEDYSQAGLVDLGSDIIVNIIFKIVLVIFKIVLAIFKIVLVAVVITIITVIMVITSIMITIHKPSGVRCFS